MKLDISMQLSLFSSSVMTDVVLSQNDILPVFPSLCQRKYEIVIKISFI